MAEPFKLSITGDVTAISVDLVAQLGPRAFSLYERPDGIYLEGNITKAEAEAALVGFATRQQQRESTASQELSDLNGLLEKLTAETNLTQAELRKALRSLLRRHLRGL